MLSKSVIPAPAKTAYPRLKQYAPTGLVILFFGPHSGTVVFNPSATPPIGKMDHFWAESDFIDLPSGSSVTLTQD